MSSGANDVLVPPFIVIYDSNHIDGFTGAKLASGTHGATAQSTHNIVAPNYFARFYDTHITQIIEVTWKAKRMRENVRCLFHSKSAALQFEERLKIQQEKVVGHESPIRYSVDYNRDDVWTVNLWPSSNMAIEELLTFGERHAGTTATVQRKTWSEGLSQIADMHQILRRIMPTKISYEDVFDDEMERVKVNLKKPCDADALIWSLMGKIQSMNFGIWSESIKIKCKVRTEATIVTSRPGPEFHDRVLSTVASHGSRVSLQMTQTDDPALWKMEMYGAPGDVVQFSLDAQAIAIGLEPKDRQWNGLLVEALPIVPWMIDS